MHITIITIGTRGDVQPCIALGRGLQAAGHTVRLATHTIYREFVTGWGLEFHPISGNPREVLEGEGGISWLETGRNPYTMLTQLRELTMPLVHEIVRDCYEACLGTDMILCSTLGFLPAVSIIEKLRLPAIGVYLQPLHTTRDFPAVVFPELSQWLPMTGAYNEWSHVMVMELAWRLFKEAINSSRDEILGLPPLRKNFRELMREPFPAVYGFSRHVVPPPSDWGDHIRIGGYWFLDDTTWQPPADLIDFLEAGTPPVYIGFGSMSNRHPETVTEMVIEAMMKIGERALLLTGWGGIKPADLPDTIFKIDSAPHHWLFPRMAAVVHHGGAGTTAAGLRSGVPAVVVPHFADQPYWARRVADLGVGPMPIQRKRLTVDSLVSAVEQALNNSAMRRRAQELAANIQAEDGIGSAVEMIEAVFERRLNFPIPAL